MVNQTIINTAAKYYVQQLPVDLGVKHAYLFGSYAKGNEREDSDIDIAIVVNKMDDFFAMQMQLRRSVDLRIEPHPFLERDFNIQNPFAHEIQQSGIELIA